jgi:Protein of unknown function (DUF4058)
MPVHDWTRVSAGTFHDFHCTWIPEIKNRLNEDVLPPEYYAQVEQIAGDTIADILALRTDPIPGFSDPEGSNGAVTGLATAPPRVRYTAEIESDTYAARARRVAIRHSSDDRVVALIEVLSPGNKASRTAFQTFVSKAAWVLSQGCHLLLIDLFPPGPRDPQGIHGALWAELGDDSYGAPPDKPLTLAAYSAGPRKTAYVEPLAVGDPLTPMPLFLTPSSYVTVPLEATYHTAYRGVPRRWREVLDTPG